jgi:hypothetical protein
VSVALTRADQPAGDAGRLVDRAGNVRFGIFEDPILEVNHADYRLTDPFGRPRGRLARRFAYKQFQFLGALSEDLVFGCAIADLKYIATAFVYCYDPRTRRHAEASFRRLLGAGVRLTDTPESGTTSFRTRADVIEMHADPEARRRRLVVALARGVAVDATFDEAPSAIEPLRICTRAGPTGWVFARKTAGQRVTGTLRWQDRSYDLGALRLHGHHDWSAGFMRRQTFWNWGCLAGVAADGRVLGMNVSCGVNETSFTENCFWVDGRLHKLDSVAFEYDRDDLMRPWRVRSFDGRLQLEFHPEGRHVERLDAKVLATNFHQLFGRYHGWLATASGERIAVAGMLGYMESHYAKW